MGRTWLEMRKINDELVGKTFNDFVVLKQVENYKCTNPINGVKTSRSQFLCKCKCGKEFIASGTKIRTEKTKRCASCAYKLRPQSMIRCSDIQRLYNLNMLRCEKERNIKVNLSLEEYEKIVKQSCHYCGELPRKIEWMGRNKIVTRESSLYANGIDRVDSSLDYSIDNCVPCCKTCNFMKNTMTKENFLLKIEKIYNKLIINNEKTN